MKKKGIAVLCLMTLIGGGFAYYQLRVKQEKTPNEDPPKLETVKPKLKIVDETSDSRPYAVMINNNKAAWKNHAGIQDAYMVYEAITEGGITRLMALYKDAKVERIGSVRSSRHYFLDYVLENDAIYVHFGWSPQAQDDIKSLKINNINGIYDDNAFYRDTSLNVAYEHTAYTTMDKIKNAAKEKGYRTKTNRDLLLNYSVEEVSLAQREDAIMANVITIPYSSGHITSYQYDEKSKTYLRFMNGSMHMDGVTNEQYHVKNIIIEQTENYSMDDYGRQDMKTTGTGQGYYITNGYAIPITWSKESRNSKTKYLDSNNKEIIVNDGNTFIQIEPSIMTPTISE